MPEAHSLFSASGSEGWMVCHGKIAMETGRRRTSEAAMEGTAAHTLAEWVLEGRLKGEASTARSHVGEKITVVDGNEKRIFPVTADMAEYVDDYVDNCMAASNAYGGRVIRFSEQRLNYAQFLRVPVELAFGTGDFTAVLLDAPAIEWSYEDPDSGETINKSFPAGVEAVIRDLKYGKGVRVFAPGNSQLRHYGLGVLDFCDLLADVTRVRMVIDQPRLDHISEEVISVAELLEWAKLPAAAAQGVMRVQEAFADKVPKSGYQDYREVPKALAKTLKPSEKGCRFCDARPVCPAMFAEAAEFASGGSRSTADDFADVEVDTPTDVKNYGDNWLAMAADKLDLIDSLRKAIRAEIDYRVLRKGLKVEGFKVVEGSLGDRKWTDEAKAEKQMRATGAPPSKLFKTKLVSPTQAEKNLGKAAYQLLAPLVTREPGAPSVVRTTDKRPEYTGHKASVDDFEDVGAEPGVAASSNPHPFR